MHLLQLYKVADGWSESGSHHTRYIRVRRAPLKRSAGRGTQLPLSSLDSAESLCFCLNNKPTELEITSHPGKKTLICISRQAKALLPNNHLNVNKTNEDGGERLDRAVEMINIVFYSLCLCVCVYHHVCVRTLLYVFWKSVLLLYR